MFKIYFINHFYFSQEQFPNLDDAIAHGKKAGFEFTVYQQDKQNKTILNPICTWSIITGLRYVR